MTRADGLLLCAVAAAALFLYALHALPKAAAISGVGCIRVLTAGSGGGERRLPARAGTSRIRGQLGEMEIETASDGSVRVVFSACPGQICVRQGWAHAGSSIVCVPNGVVLTPAATAGSEDPSGADGVTR
ncbi:MAG TPA: NusG domain II-containing protein [Candidatus Ozemobacteraceae bacterium]